MKVTLISHTLNPIESICMAQLIMTHSDPLMRTASLSSNQKEDILKEIFKGKLRGALEFASFEFLLEGVSRAFTHQLVRKRVFHFSQQSLRFYDARNSEFYMSAKNLKHIETINKVVGFVKNEYSKLIQDGCPTEDARSILPTNICTKIMFGANFNGLVDLAEVRLCAQTQGEFREAMDGIKREIGEKVSPFLASQLVPVCERSGRCEFKSVFDRPCPDGKFIKKENP